MRAECYGIRRKADGMWLRREPLVPSATADWTHAPEDGVVWGEPGDWERIFDAIAALADQGMRADVGSGGDYEIVLLAIGGVEA